MQWLLVLSLATGMATPAPSHPGFFDAAKLAALCYADGPDAEAGRAICLGYIVGTVDQVMAQQSGWDASRRTVCLPKTFTPEDALNVVTRHKTFAVRAKGVGAAGFVKFTMEEAYPCHPPARR